MRCLVRNHTPWKQVQFHLKAEFCRRARETASVVASVEIAVAVVRGNLSRSRAAAMFSVCHRAHAVVENHVGHGSCPPRESCRWPLPPACHTGAMDSFWSNLPVIGGVVHAIQPTSFAPAYAPGCMAHMAVMPIVGKELASSVRWLRQCPLSASSRHHREARCCYKRSCRPHPAAGKRAGVRRPQSTA